MKQGREEEEEEDDVDDAGDDNDADVDGDDWLEPPAWRRSSSTCSYISDPSGMGFL